MNLRGGDKNPTPNPDLPGAIQDSGSGALGPLTLSATLRTRMNYSVQHLLVSASLAREVDAIETSNAGAEFGSFWDDVLGYSVGCVVLAAAALEAYVNELFADRDKHFSAHDQAILNLLWEEYERKSLVDKFDLALRLRTGTALDRGATTTQAIERLISLRNALVHFKPEWFDEQAEHVRLSEKLKDYVGRSAWLRNEPLFPRAWATHATTSWAVSSVVEFVASFSAASGIEDRIAKFRDRLSTARRSS